MVASTSTVRVTSSTTGGWLTRGASRTATTIAAPAVSPWLLRTWYVQVKVPVRPRAARTGPAARR